MQDRSASEVLQSTIQLLEIHQSIKEEIFREQLNVAYERLKPLNLLRSTFQEVTSSPNLFENILGTTVGLATGYLSKKIMIGTSGNIFRKFFGFLMQVGITNTVAKHPETVNSIGRYIYRHFLHKKESDT